MKFLPKFKFFKNLSLDKINELIADKHYEKAIRYLKWLGMFNESATIFFYLALCYYYHHNYSSGIVAIKKALAISPDSASSQLLYGQLLIASGLLDEADAQLTPLFMSQPSRDVFNVIEELYLKKNNIQELRRLVEEVMRLHPLSGINERTHSRRHLTERVCDLPPILFSSLPKSGSIYISSRLASALHMPIVRLTLTHPSYEVLPAWVESFALGGVIAQEHLNPDHDNLALLKKCGIEKVVVHIRDPRSAVISMMHHLDKSRDNGSIMKYITDQTLGDAHFSAEKNVKIQNVFDRFFLKYVTWIENWLQVAEQNIYGIKILFTSYNQLHADEKKLFEDILQFYQLPFTYEMLGSSGKESKSHHRKGLLEEWREVYTPEQRDFAWSKIEKMAPLFQWQN